MYAGVQEVLSGLSPDGSRRILFAPLLPKSSRPLEYTLITVGSRAPEYGKKAVYFPARCMEMPMFPPGKSATFAAQNANSVVAMMSRHVIRS